jgi:hypothetical protein
MIIKKYTRVPKDKYIRLKDLFLEGSSGMLGSSSDYKCKLDSSLRLIEDNGGSIVTAENNGLIQGFILATDIHPGNLISIEYTAVSKRHMGKGVFKRMLALLIENEHREIGLACLPHLKSFYSDLGFKPIDSRSGFLIMITHTRMLDVVLKAKNSKLVALKPNKNKIFESISTGMEP